MTPARYYCRRALLEIEAATFTARMVVWATVVTLATVAGIPVLFVVGAVAPDVLLTIVALIEEKQARYEAEGKQLTADFQALVDEWNADVAAELEQAVDDLVAAIRERKEAES